MIDRCVQGWQSLQLTHDLCCNCYKSLLHTTGLHTQTHTHTHIQRYIHSCMSIKPVLHSNQSEATHTRYQTQNTFSVVNNYLATMVLPVHNSKLFITFSTIINEFRINPLFSCSYGKLFTISLCSVHLLVAVEIYIQTRGNKLPLHSLSTTILKTD